MVKVGDYVALKGLGWGDRQGEVVRVKKVIDDLYTAEEYYPDIAIEGYDPPVLGPYPDMIMESVTRTYGPIGQSYTTIPTPISTAKTSFSLVPDGTDEPPLKLSKDDIDAIAEVVIQKLKARL